MKSAKPFARTLPDYISIPDHLKATPIASLSRSLGKPGLHNRPARLLHLFEYAGIRSLGDLDGKRLSDFESYRNCGRVTIWALRCLIFRALHPQSRLDRHTWPVPMWAVRPPETRQPERARITTAGL